MVLGPPGVRHSGMRQIAVLNMEKAKRKIVLKLVATNALLFVVLYGLVTLNKAVLRPMLGQVPFAGALTGVFPNFIAAYLVSLAFVNAVVTRKPRYGHLIVCASSLLVAAILTIEELHPMWGASTHYDFFDIVASIVGSLLAVLTFEIIALKKNTARS